MHKTIYEKAQKNSNKIGMKKRGATIIHVFTSLVLIIIGGGIYYAYRSDTLIMFKWVEVLHLQGIIEGFRRHMSTYTPSEFTVFNLPDGLWSISYLLIIYTIWGSINRYNIIWFCFMPCIALLSEFMQLFSFFPGRFDWWDAICYTIPLITLITTKIIKKCTKKFYFQLEQ